MFLYLILAAQVLESPGRYGVRGIPTLGFFLNGQMIDTVVGALPKSALKSAVERHLVATTLN